MSDDEVARRQVLLSVSKTCAYTTYDLPKGTDEKKM